MNGPISTTKYNTLIKELKVEINRITNEKYKKIIGTLKSMIQNDFDMEEDVQTKIKNYLSKKSKSVGGASH